MIDHQLMDTLLASLSGDNILDPAIVAKSTSDTWQIQVRETMRCRNRSNGMYLAQGWNPST
jgi:hypothetical protein